MKDCIECFEFEVVEFTLGSDNICPRGADPD